MTYKNQSIKKILATFQIPTKKLTLNRQLTDNVVYVKLLSDIRSIGIRSRDNVFGSKLIGCYISGISAYLVCRFRGNDKLKFEKND